MTFLNIKVVELYTFSLHKVLTCKYIDESKKEVSGHLRSLA